MIRLLNNLAVLRGAEQSCFTNQCANRILCCLKTLFFPDDIVPNYWAAKMPSHQTVINNPSEFMTQAIISSADCKT